MMKDIQDILLNRTSIRRYERESIPAESIEFIYEAICNTATSYNGQQFSVIAIDDPKKKEALYEITNQKQIKTCALCLVFCVDYHKIRCAAAAKGVEYVQFEKTLDGVMVGLIDAALAMSNAMIAAHAQGLGTCCIGYTRTANPQKIAELLHLPQGVFVACGLSIGVPREQPDVKPKQSRSLVIHSNEYPVQGMEEALIEYDQLIGEYNQQRSGDTTTNDWIAHMMDYYRMAIKYNMEEYIRQQGFDMKSEK